MNGRRANLRFGRNTRGGKEELEQGGMLHSSLKDTTSIIILIAFRSRRSIVPSHVRVKKTGLEDRTSRKMVFPYFTKLYFNEEKSTR